MFVEPRHDLHEIAGHVSVIELCLQNTIPGILAGARRAGQHEDESGVGDATGCPRLDRRRADLVVGDTVEHLGKSVHPLFEQRFQRFGVTSRPVKPVPPVVMTTSIVSSCVQASTWSPNALLVVRNDGAGSKPVPASAMRATNVSPDLSSASVRVSETVSTAMPTGMKGLASLEPAIMRLPLSVSVAWKYQSGLKL